MFCDIKTFKKHIYNNENDWLLNYFCKQWVLGFVTFTFKHSLVYLERYKIKTLVQIFPYYV